MKALLYLLISFILIFPFAGTILAQSSIIPVEIDPSVCPTIEGNLQAGELSFSSGQTRVELSGAHNPFGSSFRLTHIDTDLTGATVTQELNSDHTIVRLQPQLMGVSTLRAYTRELSPARGVENLIKPEAESLLLFQDGEWKFVHTRRVALTELGKLVGDIIFFMTFDRRSGLKCFHPNFGTEAITSPNILYNLLIDRNVVEIAGRVNDAQRRLEDALSQSGRLAGEVTTLLQELDAANESASICTAESAVILDERDRAIAVAKREAQKVADLRAEVAQQQSEKSLLGGALKELLEDSFRIRSTLVKAIRADSGRRTLRYIRRANKQLSSATKQAVQSLNR